MLEFLDDLKLNEVYVCSGRIRKQSMLGIFKITSTRGVHVSLQFPCLDPARKLFYRPAQHQAVQVAPATYNTLVKPNPQWLWRRVNTPLRGKKRQLNYDAGTVRQRRPRFNKTRRREAGPGCFNATCASRPTAGEMRGG